MIESQKTLTAATATLAAAMMMSSACAQDAAQPRLDTNEAYITELSHSHKLAIDDPMTVFAYVLGSLPERVKVYPTENHYYFSFDLNGVRYAGNIKIDARLRAEGKVVFSYYEDRAAWLEDTDGPALVLGSSQGVTVEKVEPLVYRVRYAKTSVVFALNDLSQVKPPAGAIGPGETYLGPIFDESAIRYFLVFNKKLKIFHYILDETIDVADQFIPAAATDRILIGKRTGFAFYRDQRLDRKILIGVFEGNSRVNNYFDGPFDQLPDNFIEGETLRDAILAADPSLKGRIDRFGISPGGEDRYLIGPYRHYRTEEDLLVFHECATDKKLPSAKYYECFVWDEDEAGEAPPPSRPPAKKKTRPGPNRTVAKRH